MKCTFNEFDSQDYSSGRSKKFGFVEFESPESKQKALETETHVIEGAKVKTKLRINTTTSYVQVTQCLLVVYYAIIE